MYAVINEHIEALLGVINPAQDVQPYVWLLQVLPNTDVAGDREFQRVYRRYWQLNPARLSDQFYAAYFGHLQQLKGQTNASVEAVARYLLAIPTHGDGRQSLQFSFSTKLVHMLRPDQPVYDNMVASFFFLPLGNANENAAAKLTKLLASYQFLVNEYTRILHHGLLAHAIARFREHFQVGSDYSDRKIIDTLIWKFVGFLRSGAVRDGVVVYGKEKS